MALSTPSRAAAYARICPDAYETETGVVVGRVRDVDDQSPLADATVTTDWTEYTLTAGRTASHRVRAAARTNLQGVYLLCGVPSTVPLDVHTELAGFSAGPTPLLLQDRLIGRADFALSRQAQPLKPVAVKGSAILPSWMERSGFETRRLQGMGGFLTEQDIARHGFSDLISVLQGVRGVNVEWGGTGKTGGIAFPLRTSLASAVRKAACAAGRISFSMALRSQEATSKG